MAAALDGRFTGKLTHGDKVALLTQKHLDAVARTAREKYVDGKVLGGDGLVDACRQAPVVPVDIQRHQADQFAVAAGVKEFALFHTLQKGAPRTAGVEDDGPAVLQLLKGALHGAAPDAVALGILLHRAQMIPALQMQHQQLPSQALAHKLLFVDGSDHAQPPLFCPKR